MNAYITLLSTMSYLPGVIVLHDSIIRTQTSYPFWVAVSSSIPVGVDDELRRRGMHVTRLSAGFTIPIAFKENSGHWGNTFDKIQLFGLSDFDKLVYLDSDMIVLKNIDELFDKSHMSAVAAGQLENPDWLRLNSGLMVISPDKQLPEKMMGLINQAIEDITALGNNKIGDQDVVNAYYSDWPERQDLHLDQGFNIFFTDLDGYIVKHGYRMNGDHQKTLKDIHVIHFVGPNKPWMKWAKARHFLETLKKGSSVRWERQAFLMYCAHLKKLQLN